MIQYAFKCNTQNTYMVFEIYELRNSINIQYYNSNTNEFSSSRIMNENHFFDFYKILRNENLHDAFKFKFDFNHSFNNKTFYLLLSFIRKHCKKCFCIGNRIFNINKLSNDEIRSFVIRLSYSNSNKILNGVFINNKLTTVGREFYKLTENSDNKVKMFCYDDCIINF